MMTAGFTRAGVDHPIIPVTLGDAKLAQQMAELLLGHGIYVVGFSFLWCRRSRRASGRGCRPRIRPETSTGLSRRSKKCAGSWE